jgi:hypothetical protein
VSNLETQVQVQTVYGVSRSATAAFPTCAAACQNNGTCWWSKDAIALECVCTSYLYYGAQCQNSASFPTTNWLPTELNVNLDLLLFQNTRTASRSCRRCRPLEATTPRRS